MALKYIIKNNIYQLTHTYAVAIQFCHSYWKLFRLLRKKQTAIEIFESVNFNFSGEHDISISSPSDRDLGSEINLQRREFNSLLANPETISPEENIFQGFPMHAILLGAYNEQPKVRF